MHTLIRYDICIYSVYYRECLRLCVCAYAKRIRVRLQNSM